MNTLSKREAVVNQMRIVVKKAQKTLLIGVDQAYTGVREHPQHPPTPEGIVMADIILIAVTIAFFAICALYVQWCDRIIGPDEFGPKPESADDADDADVADHDAAKHSEVMA